MVPGLRWSVTSTKEKDMSRADLEAQLRGRASVHRNYCEQFRKAGRFASAEWHAGKASAYDAAADLLDDVV
jgi:hypothetical protein